MDICLTMGSSERIPSFARTHSFCFVLTHELSQIYLSDFLLYPTRGRVSKWLSGAQLPMGLNHDTMESNGITGRHNSGLSEPQSQNWAASFEILLRNYILIHAGKMRSYSFLCSFPNLPVQTSWSRTLRIFLRSLFLMHYLNPCENSA